MPNTLEAALQLQQRGMSIIPVGRNKKPMIKWEKYQSKHAPESDIRYWYKKWPHANIGIITGKISRISVLDADNQDAFNLIDNFLPESFTTPTAKTPKGKHIYFSYSNKINTTAGLSNGLDIRNDGGYVVAPPGQNMDGEKYEWLISPFDSAVQKIPDVLLDILLQLNHSNNNIEKSIIYREADYNGVTTSYNSFNLFEQGRRDNDLFHIANCLIRGGAEEKYVIKTMELLASCCSPPFDKKEVAIKIESALKREDKREKLTKTDILNWVGVTNGIFSITDLYKEVTIVSKKHKNYARVILHRLVAEGVLEKVGSKDGYYRKIEDRSRKIDLKNISEKEFKIKYPLNIEELIITQPKNIIIFAGDRDVGKSCFCLNIAKLNMNRRYPVKYLTSEMGGIELKARLKKFEPDMMFEEWFNMEFLECSSNFQDSINPDGLNIIDYLKLEDNFYLIGGEIRRIFEKLNDGIAIIALQKKEKERLGVGGQFTTDEARLYVTLSRNPPHGAIARIEKAKNWRHDDRNPLYLSCDFKILSGSKIHMTTDWSREE